MTDATAPLPNPAVSNPRGFTYPRRCDAIAARGHRHLVAVIGLGTVLLLVWAALTTLEKVTRGSGRVVSQTRNQLVQHLEGGIVADILVREGQQVAVGQPLVRVDNSFSRAELQQNRVELMARELQVLRLQAEARGDTDYEVPELTQRIIPAIVAQE